MQSQLCEDGVGGSVLYNHVSCVPDGVGLGGVLAGEARDDEVGVLGGVGVVCAGEVGDAVATDVASAAASNAACDARVASRDVGAGVGAGVVGAGVVGRALYLGCIPHGG